ncbi:MAG: alpha/beta fold hydrolase [Deltaproteobacteria bacterium]|nr:alpha/beta fold hydrolase [Deltaproteobacteria bacterium]
MDAGNFIHQAGNGGSRTVVLLPGFATDGRIFSGLELDCNRVLPRAGFAAGMAQALPEYLRGRGEGPVTILGWSLGGFVGAAFARAHPGLVDHLVLVGIRRRYGTAEITRMRESLEKDRVSCLTEFYARCFLPAQKEDYRRFRAGLLPLYLREMDRAALHEGLSYLAASEIRADMLPPSRITLVHGERDAIAPVSEVRELAASAPRAALHVLPAAGHAAFLSGDFLPLMRELLR